MEYFFSLALQPNSGIIIIIIDFLLFGVCSYNKHCPSARCAYAANVVDKDLDIFAVSRSS
jgi:hypothetical protein